MPQQASRSGGKRVRLTMAHKRTGKYVRQAVRTQNNKDRHVKRSSHGKWNSVAELERHREKVEARRKAG